MIFTGQSIVFLGFSVSRGGVTPHWGQCHYDTGTLPTWRGPHTACYTTNGGAQLSLWSIQCITGSQMHVTLS